MTVAGQVVEVRVDPRGSALVADAILGATSITVNDPSPFDDAGGQVLIDGSVYGFTIAASGAEVDDVNEPGATNLVLTLSPGLGGAASASTPVVLWSGDQVLDDVVLVVDIGSDDGQPALVTTSSTQRKDWSAREGALEPPVAVELSDDLTQLLDAPGYTPLIDGASLVRFPDPAEVALDPPPSSPAIVSITGTSTGLTVVTEPILPTTLVDFLINGVTVTGDQRTTVINLTDDGTNPLALDTDYTVTTQAHNSADPAPAPSTGVTARLDPGMTATQVTAILQAGFILAGTIQVGSSMTLDGVGGITITQTDGRQTYLRADGSGNQFVGQAVLDAAAILGALTILGQTNALNGLLTLGSGVSDPTSKPGVTAAGWDSVTFGNPAFVQHGLFDNSTEWVDTVSFFGGNVSAQDKATGALNWVQAMPTDFYPDGGVVKVGASWYVLGKDHARSSNWYCFIFNTSWVKTGEWQLVAFGGAVPASNNTCALGIDGAGGLLVARANATGGFAINAYTTAGVASAAAGTYASWPAGAEMTGIVKAAVDTATVRYVASSKSDGIRVFNTSTAARLTSEEWVSANGSEVRGLGYDGTNWFTQDGQKFWKYTNLIGTWDFAFTWVDDDAAGTGTAETKRSAIRTTAPTKRAKWTITLPSPPPDDLTTDGANTASLYAMTTGGTLVRQTALTEGTYSATYSTLATSGTAPPSTSGFASRPGAIGRIISTATAGSGNPKWDFRGDGTAVINDIAMTDTGWQNFASFGTGWVAGTITPQSRIMFGRVYLRGLVKRTSGTGTTVGTLAGGHAPSQTFNTDVRTTSATRQAAISTAGVLTIDSAYVTNDNVSLDNQDYALT